MPPIETLVAFTIAAFIMNLSPGPSNLYVIARTVSQGVNGGLSAVAGLAVGSLIHVVAAVLGLSVLFEYSPLAYATLKICGAAYLIYLGINYFLAEQSTEPVDAVSAKQTYGKIFRESVTVEVTNPKTALFFLALLPQFVVPEAGPAAPQFLILGLIVTLSAIPCDLFVTFFASRATQWMRENDSARKLQDRIAGTILTGLGSYILFAESR
ncbi:MAG: LysE family translocator [Pseudomonadales bacterium]|nr:LysE family translocator [Pseudomonadales bacterium]